jgi:hypothetical protein
MKMSNMVIDQPEPRSCVPCLNGSFQDRIIKSLQPVLRVNSVSKAASDHFLCHITENY